MEPSDVSVTGRAEPAGAGGPRLPRVGGGGAARADAQHGAGRRERALLPARRHGRRGRHCRGAAAGPGLEGAAAKRVAAWPCQWVHGACERRQRCGGCHARAERRTSRWLQGLAQGFNPWPVARERLWRLGRRAGGGCAGAFSQDPYKTLIAATAARREAAARRLPVLLRPSPPLQRRGVRRRRAAGGAPRGRLVSRRRMPRRLCSALCTAAGLAGAAVRLCGAGREQHERRHAQVRHGAQGARPGLHACCRGAPNTALRAPPV